MSNSPVTPPPGFELERGEHLAVTPPPGFELEDQSGQDSVQLPPGFELEQQVQSGRVKLPGGQDGSTSPSRQSSSAQVVDVSPAESIKSARPKRTVRPTQPDSASGRPIRTPGSDSDAETIQFFRDALAKFSDSNETLSQSSSGNTGARPAGTTPAQPDQQTPNAFSRYTSSAGQAIGVPPRMGDYIEGPKTAITHPIESARLLNDAATQAQQSVADKAYFYQHQPGFANKSKGLAYGIYSAIPFVGPSLAHAGEQFENHDFAGGFGTMTGVVLPSVIGSKGAGFREPSFRLGPSFRTGDTVVLPSGQVGTIQDAFPKIGAVRVQTQQGPRTMRVSEVAKVEAPVPETASHPALSGDPPTAQIKSGDVVSMANGRSGTVEELFPQFGAREYGRRTATHARSSLQK